MNEIKEQFRQWLLKENLEKDKAKLYVDVLKKILSKDLDAYLGYLDPLDKNIINHIKAIVLKYYEFSNANYELDRFTIWDAIGYYENVIKPLYHENALINEEDKKGVELYLYDGVDHFLTSISLRDVYEYIVIFNHVVFSQYYRDVYDINEDKQLFINKLEQLRKDLFNINFEDVALRIKYTVPRKKIKKEVLTNFCQFLYDTTKEPKYNMEKDRRLSDVENENPNKTRDGNFKESRPITGEQSAQVKYCPKSRFSNHLRDNFDYVLTVNDLEKIFHVGVNTTSKVMERFKDATQRTVLNTFYSISAVNDCLELYHNYYNVKQIKGVDYKKEGYKFWCGREKALEILGIRKQAFYKRVKHKAIYVNYAKDAPKYYKPHLRALKKAPNLIKIRIKNSQKSSLFKEK